MIKIGSVLTMNITSGLFWGRFKTFGHRLRLRQSSLNSVSFGGMTCHLILEWGVCLSGICKKRGNRYPPIHA